MRRVLMVTPHFPPDSSAASHRVRLLAPHLPEGGMDADHRDARAVGLRRAARSRSRSARAAVARDRARAGVAAVVDAVGRPRRSRVCARSPACGAPAGELLARERFDALFITIYPVYPALLGAGAEGGVRRAVRPRLSGSVGRRVGASRSAAAPNGRARLEEPRVADARHVARAARRRRGADALVAVSQGTIDGIVERMPAPARLPHGVIPLGFEPDDFAVAARRTAARRRFDPSDGLVHLCYVGTLLPTGIDTLRLLLRALERARREDPAAGAAAPAFLRHQQSVGVERVSRPAACARMRRRRRGDRSAWTARLSRRAVGADARVGDPAARQLRAALHGEQALSGAAGASGRSWRCSTKPAASCRSCGRRRPSRRCASSRTAMSMRSTARVGEVACHLRALAARAAYDPADVSLDRVAERLGAQPGAAAGRRLRSGGRMTAPVRLTAVLTHPIQYYAPWFRHIQAHAPEIALTVVYATQPTPEQQGVGFDRAFEWDVPLTDGYRSITVRPRASRTIGSTARTFTGLDVPEIGDAIADTSPDVVMITGWYSVTPRPRARRVPAARHPDALSRRLASAERPERLEARAVDRSRRGCCCGSSTASCRRAAASMSTCACSACPTTGSSACPHARRQRDVRRDRGAVPAAPRRERRRAQRFGIAPDAFVPLFVGKLVDRSARSISCARRRRLGARRFRADRRIGSARGRDARRGGDARRRSEGDRAS